MARSKRTLAGLLRNPGPARGHAGALVIAGVAAVSALAAAAASMAGRPDPIALASVPGDPERGAKSLESEIDLVKQRRVLAALAQAGLDGETLAAAGVTPQEATAIGAAVAEDVETLAGDVGDAVAALLAQEQATGALERLVVSGQASQQEAEGLPASRAALAAARTARDQALAAVWDAAVAEVEPAAVARLEHLLGTCHRNLPAHLRALACEPGEWRALENAVTHVRVSEALEIDPEPAAVGLVADAEAQQPAVSASGWLANLPAVSANLAAAAGQ
jgi:hypothetical protein